MDASCKIVTDHMLGCEDLARLFAKAPEKVLSAEDEHVRWKQEEGSREAAAAESRDRWLARLAEQDVQREKQRDRWNPPDLLD